MNKQIHIPQIKLELPKASYNLKLSTAGEYWAVKVTNEYNEFFRIK